MSPTHRFQIWPSAGTHDVEKVMRDTVAAVRTFDGFDDKLRRKVMASNAQGLLPRFAQLQ
jgi:hypothetical protein